MFLGLREPRLVLGFVATFFVGDLLAQEMMGFSKENAERERASERVMAALPDAELMHQYHYALTRKPHHAGTEANYEYAIYIRDKLNEFGYETEMFKYDILVPWAGENRITLTEPETAEIAVTEPPHSGRS